MFCILVGTDVIAHVAEDDQGKFSEPDWEGFEAFSNGSGSEVFTVRFEVMKKNLCDRDVFELQGLKLSSNISLSQCFSALFRFRTSKQNGNKQIKFWCSFPITSDPCIRFRQSFDIFQIK